MAEEIRPSFHFYAGDWIKSTKRQKMSYEAQGVYVLLLSFAWKDGGLDPDLIDIAAIIPGISVKKFINKIWPQLQNCFELTDGRLRSPRQEVERKRAVGGNLWRQIGGLFAADKRWQPNDYPHGFPYGRPMPSSSSSSSSIYIRLSERVNNFVDKSGIMLMSMQQRSALSLNLKQRGFPDWVCQKVLHGSEAEIDFGGDS